MRIMQIESLFPEKCSKDVSLTPTIKSFYT